MSPSEKAIEQLRKTLSTFSENVSGKQEKEFQKFMSSFNLSSNGSDIARILEWEDNVSRYYADLVPNVISAEVFWG
ncbi:unnamed protein product, partial [Symbiodinium microadriaticum]